MNSRNQFFAILEQFNNQRTSQNQKQLGCHNVNLNDDFDTSLTSRSNTRKNLHRHQAPSGSGSSLLISHNGPAHINWIEFAIIVS
ncbi:hypothetical protein SynMITS9220_01541 [Synechococcus sp. MIT S9220]|nr:hypothetical protein SynMITS9220_01541 [Synechococcus sp. MIT S9220]